MSNINELKRIVQSTNFVDNEVEIQMNVCGLDFLNSLYSTITPTTIDYYMEVYWFTEENVKYRRRFTITESDLQHTPNVIIRNRITTTPLTIKNKIQEFSFEHFKLVESSEVVEKFDVGAGATSTTNTSQLKYRVVTNIIFDLKSVLIDFKHITPIYNSPILSQLKKVDKHTIFSSEFEIKRLEGVDEFINSLYKRFMCVSSLNDLNIGPLNSMQHLLQTNTIGISELIKFDDYSQWFVTPKIDGKLVKFSIKDNTCLVQNAAAGMSNVRSFTCDTSKTKGVLSGYGEYLFNSKIKHNIYPVCVYMDNVLVERDLINNVKFPPGIIKFRTKDIITGFQTPEEFFTALGSLLKAVDTGSIRIDDFEVQTDGVIVGKVDNIFTESRNNSDVRQAILEYKVKTRDTVDLYTVFNKSGSETLITTKNQSRYINLVTYFTSNETPTFHKSQSYRLPESVTFNNKGQFLVYWDKIANTKTICFNKSIVEILQPNELVRFRSDKTFNTWSYRKNFGNNEKVVKQSKSVDIDIIDQLSQNYTNTKLELAQKFHGGDVYDSNIPGGIGGDDDVDLDDPGLLNKELSYYENPNTDSNVGKTHRSFSNFVVSNVMFPNSTKFSNSAKIVFLDVDGGRGGALEKAYFSEVKYYLYTEIDRRTKAEAVSRYDRMKTTKSAMYGFKAIRDTLRSNKYADNVQKMMHEANVKSINLIYIGFSLHFSLDTTNATSSRVVMDNLSKLTTIGSKIIITTMDGDVVDKLLQSVTKIVKVVDKDYRFTITRGTTFANTLSIQNEMVGKSFIDEYIIRSADLIRIFKQYKFELVESDTFRATLNNFERFFSTGSHAMESKENTRNFLTRIADGYKDTNYDISTMDLFRYYVFIRT